jgi:putative spermidine/putrescine transport system substrate-binding protein
MASAISIALRVLLLASPLALAACGAGKEHAPKAATSASAEPARALEGHLDLLALADAVAPGAFGDFARDTGCAVQSRLASSPAELLELAAQADADLVLATGDTAASLVSSGRVRAIDARRLPEVANLPPPLRALPGGVADGHRYGVPWRWQPNVLAYDTHVHAQAPASWSVLFAPPSNEASPSLLAAPEPIAIADAAIYLAATQPQLRIGDPFALDERQYTAALALLQAQRGAWRGRADNAAGQSEAFRNGVDAGPSTPVLVRAMQAEGLPVAWTVPAEGGSAQVEIAMLHSEAAHPNCALAWMRWALKPASQARLAASAGALPVVAAACRLAPLSGADACARDGMALLPKLQFQHVPQASCGEGACVPYSRWTRDYLALVDE